MKSKNYTQFRKNTHKKYNNHTSYSLRQNIEMKNTMNVNMNVNEIKNYAQFLEIYKLFTRKNYSKIQTRKLNTYQY